MTSCNHRNRWSLFGGFLVAAACVLLFHATPAQAVLVNCQGLPSGVLESEVNASWIRLQLEIPGITPVCEEPSADNTGAARKVPVIKDMGAYIGGLYKYIVGMIGILATVMVFYGGLRWMAAAGNASRVKEAKETIFAALIAIVIAFGSYLLLYTINPKLVQMRPPALKVVDTIFQSTDTTCLLKKVCFSGTNLGKECTNDGDCLNATTGACKDMVDVDPGTPLQCGTRYNYRKINGESVAAIETCIGSFCAGGQFGTEACASSNKADPTPSEGATCMEPRKRCNEITDDFADSGACSSFSIPVKDPTNNPDIVIGAGQCRWIDVSWVDINEPDDRCTWYPALGCGEGYERVGCGECNTVGKTCPDVDEITYEGEFAGLAGETPATCTSSAGEVVYAATKSGDGKNLKGICCHKKFTPMTGPNLECISNSSPPPNL